MANLKETFSKNIKAHRMSMGFRQSDVAEAIGVTTVTVNRWENGLAEASFRAVRSLAKLFRCEETELVTPPRRSRRAARSKQ